MIHNLQILRAFAAFAVVFYHLGLPDFKVGIFGVDVFFVISGFIMTHICNEDHHQFLARRLVRIVPMYWLLTIALVIIGTLRPDWLLSTTITIPHVIKSLLFIPYSEDSGLLNPILSLGWTLNYEMTFYLLTALFLYASPRFATSYASLALLLLYLAALTSDSRHDLVRFFSNDVALEFPLGVLSYWLSRSTYIGNISTFFWAISVACGTALLILMEKTGFILEIQPFRPLSYGLAASLLLLAFVSTEAAAHRFRPAFLVLLGNASYALYLTHPFVIHLFGRALPGFTLTANYGLNALLVMTFAMVVSIWVHKKIELPLTNYLRKLV